MLQIVQTFNFKTSKDAVYHMLNVCHQFQANEVGVKLSGMIEKDSNMLKEIHKYFLTITYTDLPLSLNMQIALRNYQHIFF